MRGNAKPCRPSLPHQKIAVFFGLEPNLVFLARLFLGFLCFVAFTLNSGVKWRSLAEEQEVITVQLPDRNSGPFRSRPYLQQLYLSTFFLYGVEVPYAAPNITISSFFFRFELWHPCGLDGLNTRGGGLLAGDDVSYQ